ncbi:MAG: PIG-L family deacetylase [Polyangiales bacterium]
MDFPRALKHLARLAYRDFPSDARLLVLAAHPDDETVGAASLLLDLPRCVVVHLTDGAPFDKRLWPSGLLGDRRAYAHVRRAEALSALAEAKLLPESIMSFACADQATSQHLVTLTRGFSQLLERLDPQLIVTHAYEGGHPDHDAAAFIAAHALRLRHKQGRSLPALFEMTSYHSAPADPGANITLPALETGRFLRRDECEVWTRTLDDEQRARKRKMLACYESQHAALTLFDSEQEHFRLAPHYDFNVAPHPGTLHYEQRGWLHGSEWRKRAREAGERLGLASLEQQLPCV